MIPGKRCSKSFRLSSLGGVVDVDSGPGTVSNGSPLVVCLVPLACHKRLTPTFGEPRIEATRGLGDFFDSENPS